MRARDRALNTNFLNCIFKGSGAISCLTALTLCLQAGFIMPEKAEARVNKDPRARFEKSKKKKIARLPFSKKEDKEDSEEVEVSDNDKAEAEDKEEKADKKAAKEKKKEKKEKKAKKDKDKTEAAEEDDKEADVDVQEIEILEVDEPAKTSTEESTKKTNSNESQNSDVAKDKDEEKEALGEAPRLLPDSALISVLKDVSKSLAEVDEELVNDPDEKKIVQLSREILDKSLSQDGVEADRILRPEHEARARANMIVEAWSSGDVKLRENLRGSVAAVWGKRIDGLINVTIAGECHDLKSSDGSTIGKFIVIVSAKSPVKKGFDIQSQSDVTFWIAEVANIDVDSACLKRKESKPGDGEDSEAKKESPNQEPDSLKKKSQLILEPILTDRKREFLASNKEYRDKLTALENRRQEKIAALKKEEAEARAKEEAEAEKARKEALAKRNAFRELSTDSPEGKQLSYYPDEVEIIEIVEEVGPATSESKKAKGPKSVESDYDLVQEPEEKEESKVARTRRKRTIRRYPRRFKVKDHQEENKDKQDTDKEEDKKTENPEIATKDSGEENKNVKEEEKKQEDSESEETKDDEKEAASEPEREEKQEEKKTLVTEEKESEDEEAEDRIAEASEKNIEQEAEADRAKAKAKAKEEEEEAAAEAAALAEEQKRKAAKEQEKERKKKEKKAKKEKKEKAAEKPPQEDELKKKLASITTIAPVKPREESPSSTTTNEGANRAWESPATSFILKQPSLGANLVYPDRAIAGKFLTVAVLDKYGNPESSVELSFNGATISTDASGQAMFMVPEDATPGRTLHVSLAARPELAPGVIEVLQPLFVGSETASPKIDKASKLVPDTRVLIIDGHDFIGKAKNNRVLVDSNMEAKAIAASPVQLKLKMPKSLKPGTHKVNIANTALRSNPIVFEYITAEVVEGKKPKKKGSGDLIITVKGTEKPVHVRLVNKTPAVIKINKGNELIVTTSGGSDNSSRIEIKRLQKGQYRVDANIEI